MRLTPFEEYMLVDDRLAYPMVFFYRLRFDGQLHRERFTQAVREQARREPLFSSTVTLDVSSRVETYRFVATDQEVAITWNVNNTVNNSYTIPHLDVETEVGLRLFVTEMHAPSGIATELFFQVHHACCDGLGFACFLEKCFHNYLGRTADTARDATSHSAYRIIRNIALTPLRVMQMMRLGFVYWRHSAPLSMARPNFTATAPPPLFPGSVSITLSPAATQSLRLAARARGVTVTDKLLTAVYLAIAACKHKRNTTHDARPIRLSIPVSLRNSATDKRAVNAVSMVFIDRCVKQNTLPERLLRSVARGMWWAKRLGDAEAFLWGLRFLKIFPRLLPHVVRNRNRCWATMVVSNLGVLFGGAEVRLGDATLKSVDALPPVRGWTAAALSIVTYAGKMTLALHYDTSRLAEQEATALLTNIVENITKPCS